MLEIEKLTRDFGRVRAVDAVSLSVPEGQMLSVIGRSGAGKSTLLRLTNRLIDPTSGRICCKDTDTCTLSGRALRQWRAQCAMIFQQFNLVSRLDVITNVLIGRTSYRPTLPTLFKYFPPADRAMAVLALERLDMAGQALQRADTLSGGQQQRVAIARALVQQPRMILADEPVASLDPANAKRVMDALRRINREDGITVIANLHDLEIARTYSDRIVGLVAGRVVFDGTPAELTAAKVREIYADEEPEDEPAAKPAAVARPRPARPVDEPVAATA